MSLGRLHSNVFNGDIKAIPAADHFTVLIELFEKEDSVLLKDIFNTVLK